MLLRDFAFMPRKPLVKNEDYLDYIAKYSITEDWGEQNRNLEKYVDYNFELSFDQGRIVEAPDKSYALWRVGNLLTRENEPITILCLRNDNEGKQPYRFVRVFRSHRVEVRHGTETSISPAPEGPTYATAPYDPAYRLVFNFSHYLEDNAQRVAERLSGLSDYQRFLCIHASANLAHQRGSQTATLQWYRDRNAENGSYQWLLPLHINSSDLKGRPDLVATLEPDHANREYTIRTLLPPPFAYVYARTVSAMNPPFQQWAS